MTNDSGTFEQFLLWERASRDTLEVKRTYIDMAGDLVAGVVLSQIVYWHLPSREGRARLQVQREGKLWLAKGRTEWWEECRISPKQADRALEVLEHKGLIEVRLFKFGKAPTKHVRIRHEEFLAAWKSELARPAGDASEGEEGHSDFTQRSKSILTKGKNPFSPNGEIHFPQRVKSLNTETTTETTTAASQPPSNSEPANADAALIEELVSHGVGRTVAKRFASEKPESCRRSLEYLPFAEVKTTKGAWLANAIRHDFGPPAGYEHEKVRIARVEEAERQRLAREAQLKHGAAISEEKTARLGETYRQLEETQGEAFRAFSEYVEKERARTARIAIHLTPERREELLAVFDKLERRLELFEAWMNSAPGFSFEQAASPHADHPSAISADEWKGDLFTLAQVS